MYLQEMKDNMHQHLIHVQLTHQVSQYNHQICLPRLLTFAEGKANVIARKHMYDPNIEILRKMGRRPVNFDIDF